MHIIKRIKTSALMRHKHIPFIAFLAIMAFTSNIYVTNPSCAQPKGKGGPSTPCDPEYMQALEARAWLEVQREITQNQNLIAKPDSVLEYTCFNFFLNEAASNFGPNRQFSETQRWGSISGFSNTTTDDAIDQIVGFAFRNYIQSNFAHDYLGDRVPASEDYLDYSFGVDGSTPYNCVEMARVWQLAKCTDFYEYGNRGSDPNLDSFMDFRWYESNDPRDLPTGSACSPASLYGNAIDTAFNNSAPQREASRYVLPSGDEVDFTTSAYNVDNVVTHLDFILYENHPLVGGTCQTVQTGITVDRVNITPAYPDAICPNPGCYLEYVGASSGCVTGSGGGGGGGGGITIPPTGP